MPKVSTIDFIFQDGRLTMLDIQASNEEMMIAIEELVRESAKKFDIHESQLLAALGQHMCPNNIIVIQEGDKR